MPESPKRSRRQRWLVEPEYQWKVTRMLVAALLLVIIATLLLIYYALWSTLGDLDLGPSAVFVAVFRAVAWMVVSELVLIVPIVVVMSLAMTHKVVGPLGRMNAALDQIGQGQLDIRLKLRDGDVLVDLAESINRLAVTLKQQRASQRPDS